MLHRLIRIAPLYWFSVFLLIGLSNLGLLNLAETVPRVWNFLLTSPASLITWLASLFNIFAWASPHDLLRTLLFIPYKNFNGDIHPLLGVGWTLNIEMYFYGIFSLMLYFGKSMAPIFSCAAVILVWLIGNSTGETGSSSLKLYSSDYTLYFSGGIIVYYTWTALLNISEGAVRRWLFAVLASISASIYIFSNLYFSHTKTNFPLAIALAPSLIVLAALLAHSIGMKVREKFTLLLGAASYSLYLTHTIILEMLRTPAERFYQFMKYDQTISGLAIGVAACLIAAIGVHLKVELPLMSWFKLKLFNNQRLQQAGLIDFNLRTQRTEPIEECSRPARSSLSAPPAPAPAPRCRRR